MLRLFFIFFLFIAVSCSKDPAIFPLQNLNNNEIGCFGHAGMGSKSIYPINTFEGMESCLERGADGTEMDIQVTKDSVLVIYHGESLSSSTSCSGSIKELNWSDINDCKMNSTLFKHLKLMSFDEFIQKIPNPNNYMFTLDCKANYDYSGDQSYYFNMFARTIVKTMARYNLDQNILIENLDPGFLLAIQRLKTDAKLFVLTDDFDLGMATAKQWGFYGLSMSHTSVTAKQIKEAHDQNIRVTLYGVVTEKENYAAVEKSPDFIQTDDIVYLLKIFGKYKKHRGYYYSLTK